MKPKNRFLLLFLLCLFTAVLVRTGISEAAPPRELPKPDLIAVYFYADWCGNCKILEPALNQARATGKFNERKVLFVTLDLTDKPRINQSVMLAQTLGIGSFVQAQGSATGYIAILDAETREEVARFDRDTQSAAILENLETLLKERS